MSFKRLIRFANETEKEQILEAVFSKQTLTERFQELREKREEIVSSSINETKKVKK